MSKPQKIHKTERKGELLTRELERLKEISSFGSQLSVIWIPGGNLSLAGEVKNDIIIVYETDIRTALNTVRHEFFDYLICTAIRPYQQVTVYYQTMFNSLVAKLGESAYTEKERTIEVLSRFASKTDFRQKKGEES